MVEKRKSTPQTTADRPVRPPVLIPGADSGEIMMGPHDSVEASNVPTPQEKYSHLPLGSVPSGRLRFAISDNPCANPLSKMTPMMYRSKTSL